jgi:hypothetical protein
MSDTRTPPDLTSTPSAPQREYRPSDRFWPYADLPDEPTPEELAALDPELHDALFGPKERPFSITLSFPEFDGDDFEQAVALAREAPEYREVGTGGKRRYRARFYPDNALELRDLFQIVGRHDDCHVLVDDRAVPFARELWLPLMWLLIRPD